MAKLSLKEMAPIALSIVAVAISASSYFAVQRQHDDSIDSQVIRTTYSEFLRMNDLRTQNWKASHMFALPSDYARNLCMIIEAIAEDKALEAEIRLLELGIAQRLFTMYEHAFYQWEHAKEHSSDGRRQFMEEVLGYYTGRLLRNPRLLWHWSTNGGNMQQHFEPDVIEHYEANVILVASGDKLQTIDAIGPSADNIACDGDGVTRVLMAGDVDPPAGPFAN